MLGAASDRPRKDSDPFGIARARSWLSPVSID